jgi:hypothetical protein
VGESVCFIVHFPSSFSPVLFEIVFSGRAPIVLSNAWFGQHAPAFFPNPTRFSANALRFIGSCSGLPTPSPLGVILNPAHHVRLCGKNKERVFATTLPSCAPGVGPLGFGPEARMGAHSLPGKQVCRWRGSASQIPVLENRRWAGSESAGWG